MGTYQCRETIVYFVSADEHRRGWATRSVSVSRLSATWSASASSLTLKPVAFNERLNELDSYVRALTGRHNPQQWQALQQSHCLVGDAGETMQSDLHGMCSPHQSSRIHSLAHGECSSPPPSLVTLSKSALH